MTKQQLSKILAIPAGSTSFHTEAGKIVFLLGKTGAFVEQDLTTEQAEQLSACGVLGTFGQPIVA